MELNITILLLLIALNACSQLVNKQDKNQSLENHFDVTDSVALQNVIREVTWPYGVEIGYRKFLTIWYVKKNNQWEYVDIYQWDETYSF